MGVAFSRKGVVFCDNSGEAYEEENTDHRMKKVARAVRTSYATLRN